MKYTTGTRCLHHAGLASILLLAGFILILSGCSSSSDSSSQPRGVTVVGTAVTAATGGSFSDDPAQPAFTLTIPPNSLQADGQLVIERIVSPPGAGTNQTAASQAFRVTLTDNSGAPAVLMDDMVIEMVADTAPVHPQLGEVALQDGTTWVGLDANYFRSSENIVVALTRQNAGTFRVILRNRRLATGQAVADGLEVFLNETFGNENFFGPTIGLHTLLNNVTPAQVVPLGVQVDLTKVPQDIVDVMIGTDLAAKDNALNSAATTQQLIKAGAVIGVKGFYATTDPGDTMMISAGITCALCHVNVTPTQFELTAGLAELPIGPPELDGVPNARMDAGAILALTDFAVNAGQAIVDILNSWGPGAFDIRALPDNVLDDGVNNPTSNPPLWNFLDLQDLGYRLGWDGLFLNDGVNNNALASQAEAVYDLVMHGNGAFGTPTGNFPPELAIVPPQELLEALEMAEQNDPGNDLDSQKLLDLQSWMQSIPGPAPGTFDETMAEAGFRLFYGKATCVSCHSNREIQGPGVFTGIQPAQGDLAGGIHVPSLRGVSRTAPYFHNNAAADLEAAVSHFVDNALVPALTPDEQAQLVEFLKSL